MILIFSYNQSYQKVIDEKIFNTRSDCNLQINPFTKDKCFRSALSFKSISIYFTKESDLKKILSLLVGNGDLNHVILSNLQKLSKIKRYIFQKFHLMKKKRPCIWKRPRRDMHSRVSSFLSSHSAHATISLPDSSRAQQGSTPGQHCVESLDPSLIPAFATCQQCNCRQAY